MKTDFYTHSFTYSFEIAYSECPGGSDISAEGFREEIRLYIDAMSDADLLRCIGMPMASEPMVSVHHLQLVK